MRIYILAACWAVAMLVLALLARTGLVDRDAAAFLLLVMPMIAFVTLLGRRDCQSTAQGA